MKPRPSLWRRSLAEGIGTFFLVLIGPGAVMVDAYAQGALGTAGIALAFAFVVLAMIYALGHLSGAHINPAVTVAFWAIGRVPRSELPACVAAQCTGATLGAATLRFVMGPIGQMGTTLPHIGVPRAFLVEWRFSFVLMLVIMAVATDERDPARSLGPAIVLNLWTGHWLYWVAPITGMWTAARVYTLVADRRDPGHLPGSPVR